MNIYQRENFDLKVYKLTLFSWSIYRLYKTLTLINELGEKLQRWAQGWFKRGAEQGPRTQVQPKLGPKLETTFQT